MHSKNEETEAESAERYDEFGYPRQQQDAAASCARRLSVQSSRSQSNKSPLPLTSSDEGIESDASDLRSSSGGGGGGGKRRGSRCWSFDSSATSASSMSGGSSVAEDEAMILLLEQQHSDEPSPKSKVVRCCSSDSAVLSDDDQSKGENDSSGASAAAASPTTTSSSSCPRSAGRYWRTPSVVVSDYSDYSYLEERFERSDDSELDRVDCCGGGNGGPAGCSRASSCSYLNIDDDDDRDDDFFDDTSGFEITTAAGLSARGVTTRRRRHSDSCCLRPTWTRSNSHQAGGAAAGVNSGRRNSCLATSSRLAPNDSGSDQPDGVCDPTLAAGPNYEEEVVAGTAPDLELLCPPPQRKISDCSTLSSLSGDDESADFGQLVAAAGHKRSQSSGWRKLRSIVHWTPFFQTYKKQRYPWVQLAGHQGNFRPGPKPGTILKKLCPQEEACFQLLMKDVLRPYVPEYLGALELRSEEQQPPAKVEAAVEASQTATDNHKNNNVNNNNINNNYNNNNNNNSNSNSNGATGCKDSYLQLQDLLADFKEPCVMDCKVGVRTYLESELAKAKERPKLRKDMYEKMVQVDPTAPSDEERQLQGVTKPRYMVWRETISSTATLGFRVEGIKLAQAGSSKDFKTTRTRQQVMDAIRRFVEGYPHAAGKYLQRLQAIRATLRASSFFAGHEVVGSSLLFVHDARAAGVWMIDFAKTLPLPEHLERIRHDAVWQVGNHEDGYLIGVNNLIDIFKEIVADGVAAVDGGVEAAAAAEAVVVDDHDGPT
ncbi:inositol-trisphosphate 3-kinase B isoform X2 [Trichogramma pretiosum]|uniref:inositol-trisphosphate 3-kinase B isoform X2 n=1 Tax=Trichogramma pretiosum TaxID=7493 RepID=UPI0006C99F12|nr:inositol-trisphosphate 3-kinase B isoform X2 [Trichogramma pretiosum]